MVVRSWSVSQGKIHPRGRHRYLRETVELITAGKPGVVCLQELPAWSLDKVGEWAGMQAVAAQSRRSKLGPIPIPALVGRLLSGVFGTAAGLGNAILLTPEAHIREVKTVTLNTGPYVEESGARLGLGKKQMRRRMTSGSPTSSSAAPPASSSARPSSRRS